MSEGGIRFRAAAVFQIENRVLVHKVSNKDDGRTWFIPPGGGVHFGEDSRTALVREIREELGWKIDGAELIGTFESFHAFNCRSEHEVSSVYRVSQENIPAAAHDPLATLKENDGPKIFQWINLDDAGEPGSLLYPAGLIDKLRMLP